MIPLNHNGAAAGLTAHDHLPVKVIVHRPPEAGQLLWVEDRRQG
ncbi:hypothetical protein roselon_00609 [Roseibacterium elongatum DSM 19469]|uniref:Uncharacterized protein n=1 Tax=Roseicyclus elongatus DSM 19469 TaxID=1294273 RepID=W8RPG6_9RHOB|nr:hypothetical protein roselon_00609 [Roseibacterium elongatum DSM 19469]